MMEFVVTSQSSQSSKRNGIRKEDLSSCIRPYLQRIQIQHETNIHKYKENITCPAVWSVNVWITIVETIKSVI